MRMADIKETGKEGDQNGRKVWKAEDKVALPSCTTEGVNYLLECVTFRRQGKRRTYHGEHIREIEE